MSKYNGHYWLVTLCLLMYCVVPINVSGNEKKHVPDVSLPDLAGKNHSLRDWKGQPLLINFWATWCAPCRKEMPELVALQTELKRHQLQIIGIALENKESVQAYLQNNPVNYPILLAPELGSTLSAELGNRLGVLPFTVFVNDNGVIEETHMGLVSGELLRTWMKNHLRDHKSTQ